MTYVNVNVQGPMGKSEIRLLVDTGSSYTWVSRDKLAALGVNPTGTRRFRSIDGSELVRRTGEAVLELMGERGTSIVSFAEGRDAQVLGAVSLEELGLEVDPRTKKLKKTKVFAAYAGY